MVPIATKMSRRSKVSLLSTVVVISQPCLAVRFLRHKVKKRTEGDLVVMLLKIPPKKSKLVLVSMSEDG